MFTQPDVAWYVKIAQGETGKVLQPFASRQMGPLVCQALMGVLHISVYSAFVVEGVAAILVLLGIVGLLLLRANANAIMLAAVGGLTFWSMLFNGLALPDLWFSAMLGVFLLLLERKHFLASALMLFPLFFSRESTLLVLICLLVAGWRRMPRVDYAVAAIASIAGMGVVKALTAGGLSNSDQMSPIIYMAGKVPWNFTTNVLAIPMWSNALQGHCATPMWQTSLHIGGMSSIGICGFDPAIPAWTFGVALSSFGLLPLLFVYLWRNLPHSIWSKDVLLRFCLVCGVISFLLAPTLGAAVPRLFGYSWPLFAVAVPMLAVKHLTMNPRIAVALLVLHLAVAWSAVLYTVDTLELAARVALLLALAGAYALGWFLLRKGTVEGTAIAD
jgi:hypothetical protein